jgi:hypothetical protein
MTSMTKNCPVLERTGDGELVGRCWFYTGESGLCPRHGDVREAIKRLPQLTDESVLRRSSDSSKGAK